ncbi:unnamed protein product [Protopolystoma xenopodis]|uniref:NADH:ubiquinone reductase (H(+)-translocating) n=1 Tax=Protopolystoma xenopodis TaxID=117903 RepID=A0A3S5BWU8_9PLAT|nr:unnamed protein product [Protopolystoma xenopodis]
MAPFYTWLPIVHAEASTLVSVCLSGYIMKLGVIGVYRVFSSLFSDIIGVVFYTFFVVWKALISIFEFSAYGSYIVVFCVLFWGWTPNHGIVWLVGFIIKNFVLVGVFLIYLFLRRLVPLILFGFGFIRRIGVDNFKNLMYPIIVSMLGLIVFPMIISLV